MRLFLLIAALDPRAELYAFDFKGTGDFGALEPVCHRYRAGDEDEDILYVLRIAARAAGGAAPAGEGHQVPAALPLPGVEGHPGAGERQDASDCTRSSPGSMSARSPSSTRSTARRSKPSPPTWASAVPRWAWSTLFGTQRPDAKSLPTGISANAVLRFCLKVMGQPANDMVLGTSMYKAGYRATMFSRSDRGICWMAGEGDDPRIVASAFVDAVGAETVVARARKMREEYGNVTGHAIGQAARERRGRLRPARRHPAVVAADEEKVWNEKVAARLADAAAGGLRRLEGRDGHREPQAARRHGAGRVGHDRHGQGHHPPRHRPRRHHHRHHGA